MSYSVTFDDSIVRVDSKGQWYIAVIPLENATDEEQEAHIEATHLRLFNDFCHDATPPLVH